VAAIFPRVFALSYNISSLPGLRKALRHEEDFVSEPPTQDTRRMLKNPSSLSSRGVRHSYWRTTRNLASRLSPEKASSLRSEVLTSEPGLHGVGDATLNGRELGVAEDLEEHIAPSRHMIQALHLNGRRSNHEIH
jgi:hypothetical protein